MAEMRRKDRALSTEEAEQILLKGEYGVLSTCGKDGFPYGVPLSYAYAEGILYFHCAAGAGHKLANILYENKACFTVVGHTKVLPEKFSTVYESVIVFGKVKLSLHKQIGLAKLTAKYCTDYKEKGAAYAKAAADKVDVYEFHIERMTGKARRA